MWCVSEVDVGVCAFNVFPSDKDAHGHSGQCPGDTKLCWWEVSSSHTGGQGLGIHENNLDCLERWSCANPMTLN